MSVAGSKIGFNHHNNIVQAFGKDGIGFQYFDQVDNPRDTKGFWTEGGAFRSRFDQLDTKSVVEIASGFGRHSRMIVDRCERLTLVDSSADATAEAAERFRGFPHVRVLQSPDGLSLPIDDASATAVFSYDAMVHFEPITIASYLSEIGRVLIPGGRAVLHHSNYSGNPTGLYTSSPGWRNYMTTDLFAHFASRAGLAVLSYYTFQWETPDSDCVSLLEKAR